MILSEIKKVLRESEKIAFQLPNGDFVPGHFHVTEVGMIQKDFIDCGGKIRKEQVCSLQLWEADDYDHRLHPDKLLHIIELSQSKLGIGDLPVEVEYQGETIGKYDLMHTGEHFSLMPKKTACLAMDQCGVENNTTKIDLPIANVCTPGGGCC